jgi:hypothetical protein
MCEGLCHAARPGYIVAVFQGRSAGRRISGAPYKCAARMRTSQAARRVGRAHWSAVRAVVAPVTIRVERACG